MSEEPKYRGNISLRLSKVLDGIGVNEKMVKRRRKHCKLLKAMRKMMTRLTGQNITFYYLGSQCEGTTSMGLNSDVDILICDHDFNIIQDWSEWEHGKKNYLMIQDKNTTPGYCFLQLLEHNEPLPATIIPDEHHVTDGRGRVLYKNSVMNSMMPEIVGHGPSLPEKGQRGFIDTDKVLAYPCKSWHRSASGWLDRQGIGRWPTQDMRKHAASTGCFVVATGSKVSKNPDLEWRIPTSLAERYIVLQLNITQIRCYVLLKMILKFFGKTNLSSFMCKTVLLHCIENKEPSLWKENNLLKCLKYCLSELRSCVQNDRCSHFIIQENNLMAGQITDEEKEELFKKLSKFIQDDIHLMLCRINIDDLGHRLQVSLGMVPHGVKFYQSSVQIYERSLTLQYINTALLISKNHKDMLTYLNNRNITRLKHCIGKITTFRYSTNIFERCAFKLIAPFLFTTYGSAQASSSIDENSEKASSSIDENSAQASSSIDENFALASFSIDENSAKASLSIDENSAKASLSIDENSAQASSSFFENNQVSPKAFFWLYDGLFSDISSSRLKLASVFYCTGDMEKAELILRETEQQYYSRHVVPICDCFNKPPSVLTAEFIRVCIEQNQNMDCIKEITAFCVRFIQEEINCVPHELQYEMFRSTKNDMIHDRHWYTDCWMDWAVVDSLPFLYFLQYKIYRHLQRHQDKKRALSKLIRTTVKDPNLTHRETAFNILGQCMEQENRPEQALRCYLLSLKQRERNNEENGHICNNAANLHICNNAANLHICKLLSGLLASQ